MAIDSRKKQKPAKAPKPGPAVPANVAQGAQQTLPPDLQKAQSDLQAQVASGGINQAQANAELARQTQLYQQSHPAISNASFSSPTNTINTANANAAGSEVAANTHTNPNTNGPFGSQNISYDPVTGQPTVNNYLSGGNTSLVNETQHAGYDASKQIQGITGDGNVPGYLDNAIRNAGPQQGPSQSLIDSIYGHLTQHTDQDYGRDKENLSQSLANRGIPVGSAAYDDQMQQLNQHYDSIKSDAQNQATTAAYNQSVNQQQANTGSLQATTGTLSPLSSLQSSAYFNPQFGNFQAQTYQQPNVDNIYSTFQGGQNAAAAAAATTAAAKAAANAAITVGAGHDQTAIQTQPQQTLPTSNPPG